MKAHLLTSESPLKEGQSFTALCGAEIPCGVFCFFWDELAVGTASMLEIPKVACPKCRLKIGEAVSRGYIYGVRQKSEAA